MILNLRLVCPTIAVTLLAAAASAQSVANLALSPGTSDATPVASANLFGITKGPEGAPLAGVRVIVRSLDDNSDRLVTTDAAGAFAAPDLKPGRYRLMASKEGFVSSPDSTVELAANQSLRADLTLHADSVAPVAAAAGPKPGFVKRFFQAYADDWKPAAPNAAASPAPKFRGYPAPVDGPPYPFSVWPYGGSVTIGQPWTQAGPLMTAIWGGSNGDWWKKTGVQIYGWLNAGANVSTSKGGGYSNFPEAYAERQGFELDQEVLYIERQPDTVQTDHVDWGFRISLLYGLDYRFTTSNGFVSNQLLGKNQENGFDAPMFYFDLYVPQVAQGMDIRVGRYISLPDIEAQLAPE